MRKLFAAIFRHALQYLDSNDTAPKPTVRPTSLVEPSTPLSRPSEQPELPLPVFHNSEGEQIKVSREMEELPEFIIFQAMFERKYGKFGLCSMTIGGTPRAFSCEELYALLNQIRTHDRPEPLLISLYGTVLTVIMHAHGEETELKELN